MTPKQEVQKFMRNRGVSQSWYDTEIATVLGTVRADQVAAALKDLAAEGRVDRGERGWNWVPRKFRKSPPA